MRRVKNNVACLGDALLYHHYLPYKNESWERITEIHTEEVNIQCMRELDGQKGNFLELWGTETGIIKIDIPRLEQGSPLSFISNGITDEEILEKISHFIIRNEWKRAPYIRFNGDTVRIYRLTPFHKQIISACGSWNKQ